MLFTYSLHGHLVGLYLMAIVNNAAMNLVYKYPFGVQVSLPDASMPFQQVDNSILNHLEVGRQWV